MAIQRFLIAPFKSGLQTDLKPWMLPEDAFERLNNAYVFRGRVKKRFGSDLTGKNASNDITRPLQSRLRISLSRVTVTGGAGIGITDGAGAATGTLPAGIFTIGQRFQIGTEIFTIVALGTPAVMTTTGAAITRTIDTTTGAYVFAGATPTTQIYFYPYGNSGAVVTDAVTGNATGIAPGSVFKAGQMFSIGDEIFTVPALGTPVTMLTTGAATTHTFNTTTGVYDIQGAAVATAIYFYPAESVMGLTLYEDGPINNHTAYAFDTQFAYKYSGNSWINDGPLGSGGTSSDFFWARNWRGASVSTTLLFVSNFFCTVGVPAPVTDDSMWYYSGTTWLAFHPNFLVAGDKIFTAKIVIPFKDRLLLLNTIEQNAAATANTAYPNRCRYSHNGSPLAASAFYEPNEVGATGGGYIDSTSQEEIISARTIRDRLIVFFERSTRELVYTGNEEQPFFWQKLNTELGSEGSFSTVPFDKDLLTIGSTGIHACNGVDVYRIDEKIPEKVFEIENIETGIKRIHGIRDFDSEMVYWTFPTGAFTYPDKILVFNYKNGTWAFNDDCFTCFGYFEQQSDITWAEIEKTWSELTWTWISGVTREQHRRVLAGNQQGFILKLNSKTTTNARAMQISQIATSGVGWMVLTIIDHTLSVDDYVEVINAQGVAIAGSGIFQVMEKNASTVTVDTTYTGTYTGAGTASFVSLIDIKSKQWNPYIKDGSVIYLSKIDFCVARTGFGEITVDYSTSGTTLSLVTKSDDTDCNLGDNILQTSPYALIPLETDQPRFWHAVYFQGEGDNVQIRIYLTEDQMKDPLVIAADFELEGMVLHTQKLGRQV